jgi:hypothetical protein
MDIFKMRSRDIRVARVAETSATAERHRAGFVSRYVSQSIILSASLS